jgi:Cu(I)/Ag(I) efflux system membrane fusion protein
VRRNYIVRRFLWSLGFIAALGSTFLLAWGCRDRTAATRIEGSGLAVEARVDPAVPRPGDNRMEIRVMDSSGRPVADADVELKVTMAAMGAMPGMGGPVRVKPMGDGRYEADFKLDMDGKWRVELRVRDKAGGSFEAQGSLITGQDGIRLAPQGGAATPAMETNGDKATHPGEIVVEPARRQKIGVRTASVSQEPFGVTIRAMGVVGYDQGAIRDVAPRVMGYVGEVQVSAVGEAVRQGDVLFTLYSPELLAAQKEYLTALGASRESAAAGAPRGEALVRAAEGRLRLWGMASADIERVASTGTPIEHVPFRAPATGVVVEKSVVGGSGTQAGERLFRIAAMDHVWIEAELYEADLALVERGATAQISLAYLPGERFAGTVSLITPFLDGGTRTARARIEIANPSRALLPGMYASVELRRELGPRLVVPASAVLYAGDRRFVFVDVGEGKLRPRAVQTGLRDGERLEVLSGLEPGERIVVSGNYLIASESRLSSAMEQW